MAADQEGDMYDSAEPLTTEGTDDAVRAELEDRLAAVGRAEQRLAAGTYGVSVRSGQPIPDERLEADPTAELTVEEAAEAPGSTLFRRLPVLGVGEAPAPVGLARDLIGLQSPFGQGPGNGADDAGLGGNVDVSDPSGKIHAATAASIGSGSPGTDRPDRWTQRMSSRTPCRASRFLLVGRRVDLENGRRHGPRRERIDHRQRPRQTRLVDHEQVPVGLGAQGDLAAGPDRVDVVAGARRRRSSPSPGPSRAGRRRSSPSFRGSKFRMV